MTQWLGRTNPSTPIRGQTYDLMVTCLDALPLKAYKSYKSAYDLVKIEKSDHKSEWVVSWRSHNGDGIGVRRIRTFPFLPTPLTTLTLTFRLWSSENHTVSVGSMFPRFVIGLVLPLLLPTPTICFSLDHERNVSDGFLGGIGLLFSLDHKLLASDYDSESDSLAGTNQP